MWKRRMHTFELYEQLDLIYDDNYFLREFIIPTTIACTLSIVSFMILFKGVQYLRIFV